MIPKPWFNYVFLTAFATWAPGLRSFLTSFAQKSATIFPTRNNGPNLSSHEALDNHQPRPPFDTDVIIPNFFGRRVTTSVNPKDVFCHLRRFILLLDTTAFSARLHARQILLFETTFSCYADMVMRETNKLFELGAVGVSNSPYSSMTTLRLWSDSFEQLPTLLSIYVQCAYFK